MLFVKLIIDHIRLVYAWFKNPHLHGFIKTGWRWNRKARYIAWLKAFAELTMYGFLFICVWQLRKVSFAPLFNFLGGSSPAIVAICALLFTAINSTIAIMNFVYARYPMLSYESRHDHPAIIEGVKPEEETVSLTIRNSGGPAWDIVVFLTHESPYGTGATVIQNRVMKPVSELPNPLGTHQSMKFVAHVHDLPQGWVTKHLTVYVDDKVVKTIQAHEIGYRHLRGK